MTTSRNINLSKNRSTAELASILAKADFDSLGKEMYSLAERMFPICRSISGDGLRKSLRMLGDSVPMRIHEVPTGTKVFDWEIPREWSINDAYVQNSVGERVIDFQETNLHVVGYSIPFSGTMTLEQLRPHLHTVEEHPDWIPFRTTFYEEDWGFCLPHNELQKMPDDVYHVHIDSSLEEGSLSYGEVILEGNTDDRVLLFAHTCHPSLANDNLSGMSVLTALADLMEPADLNYTYHFVFAPTTIGSITWLSRNEDLLPTIRHGLVASVLGDPGPIHYKKTPADDAIIDRVVGHVLSHGTDPYKILDFSPWGYDERQFCSPGIDLSMGRLTRSPNGAYPEYHTSADDMTLIRPECLAKSLETYLQVITCLENNVCYRNLQPKGEPQLGKRGLYRKMGGFQDIADSQLAMLWMLNKSNGSQSVLDIAEQSGIRFSVLHEMAKVLCEHALLEPIA